MDISIDSYQIFTEFLYIYNRLIKANQGNEKSNYLILESDND